MHDTIEPLTLNAWPALQTLVYDGWLIRFANGYTKRANSVNPLYDGRIPPDQKIARCERLFRDRKLEPIYKITPCADGLALDRLLEERAYAMVDPSSVKTVDLSQVQPPGHEQVTLERSLTSAWLDSYCALSGLKPHYRATAERMLSGLALPAAFVTLYDHVGKPAACGLGVIEGEYVGLYDIVTDAQWRRRGFGEQVVLHLLQWGRENGAATAYLLVVSDNAPAIGLYDKIGFREAYRYWYRKKAGSSHASEQS